MPTGFIGRDKGKRVGPADSLTFFGKGFGALYKGGGYINQQVASAGINPGGTGNDNVLAAFTIPANCFDLGVPSSAPGGTGRSLLIQAMGSFGATGNNKRLKIIFNATTATVGSAVTGGTTIADTGTVATNTGGWNIAATVVKYGNPGSNTQLALHSAAQVGAAVAALTAPTLLTVAENAAIIVAITGNATTATTDIIFNWLGLCAANS